jgi:hypothetical protein
MTQNKPTSLKEKKGAEIFGLVVIFTTFLILTVSLIGSDGVLGLVVGLPVLFLILLGLVVFVFTKFFGELKSSSWNTAMTFTVISLVLSIFLFIEDSSGWLQIFMVPLLFILVLTIASLLMYKLVVYLLRLIKK